MAVTLNANTSTGFIATSDTSGVLQLQTGGTAAVTVDASANVGIGTASPAQKLHLASAGGTYMQVQNTAASIISYFGTSTAGGVAQVAGAYPFSIFTNGSERLTVDSSGNVGIGTASPTDSNGFGRVIDIQSTTGAAIYIRDSDAPTTSHVYLGFLGSNSTTYLWNKANGSMLFGTNDLQRAIIDSSGNFTVGAAAAATNRYININGVASKAGAIQFQESGVTKWLVGNGAASENGVFEVYSNTTGTGVQLARNATSWAAGSDERIKDIIEPITDAATKVATLRAVIGKYKTDEIGTRRSFLIAQDVQAVLPEAIDNTNLEKLGVRYTEVIPLLVAAIKEQQAIITSLTDRITALEGTTP